MKGQWSFRIFRVMSIDIEVHWTFLLLLAMYGFSGYSYEGLRGSYLNMCLILLLFTCVLLHELGHASVARYYQIAVPRIIILPIGGMAQFQRIPRRPKRELLMTIAGPLVNFVIAGSLYLMIGWPNWHGLIISHLTWHMVVQYLLIMNLFMGTFNLLPVFPMDGGRILRAFLAMVYPYIKATYIAVFIGKILAVIGIVVGIFWLNNWLLAILFVFIYLAASGEYESVCQQEKEPEKLNPDSLPPFDRSNRS